AEIHPAFPARWLDRLYALSPGTGVLAPVIGIVANLASAPGCQDHTISPSCPCRSSARETARCDTDRPSHPAPTFVTIAKRPSDRSGMVPPYTNSEKTKVKYFYATGPDSQISRSSLCKNRVFSGPIFVPEPAPRKATLVLFCANRSIYGT